MLEYVSAGSDVEVWSADDIIEDSPDDTSMIDDDYVGVLFQTSEGDGALIVGTRDEIADYLTEVIVAVRRS